MEGLGQASFPQSETLGSGLGLDSRLGLELRTGLVLEWYLGLCCNCASAVEGNWQHSFLHPVSIVLSCKHLP